MKLVIGLGNPGKSYLKTRHNVGWRVIDQLQKDLDWPRFKLTKKFQSVITFGIFQNQKIMLAKPQTFMNNSGKAVVAIKNYYKINPKDIIVVRDDIDLVFGKYREKKNSSPGGHKGVDSIIDYLKTKNFVQVKIGVKNNLFAKMDPTDFVLQKFSREEKKRLKDLLPQFVDNVKRLFEET